MARPVRCRRICEEPACRGFLPQPAVSSETVNLTMDEYEVIRLVDYEKKTHEQCAAQMEISRTTVTGIYESARFKISDSLVNGKALIISGGNYRFCRGEASKCCGKKCRWSSFGGFKDIIYEKGEFIMRIAVPYEDGMVFQHFGHTKQMKIYDVENGKISGQLVADTSGSGHGALAGFLSGLKVDVLICGGIGAGAKDALAQAGIELFGGVTGSADDAVKSYIAGSLKYNPDVHCDHHEHGHHGHDGHHGHQRNCGEDKHGCSGSGHACGK